MNTIGLIGGISWVSTLDYYRIINEEINRRRGGNEAARMIIHSVNYADIVRFTQADDWGSIARLMQHMASKLEQAGADCLLLGANTMHRIAEDLEAQLRIPLIHIADVTATAIRKAERSRVALLGTKYTMGLPFYRERLARQGVTAVIPGEADRLWINETIYHELGKGIFRAETKERYQDLIRRMGEEGAEGVILGCTEIPMLIQQADCVLPVFDTTRLHALAAVDFALADRA